MRIFSFRSSPILSRHCTCLRMAVLPTASRALLSCPFWRISSIVLIALAGMISLAALAGYGVYGFAAILGGALSHLAIDTLACPGIPLFAPFADRKYTVGILPGPSILLAAPHSGLVALTVTQVLAFQQALPLYAVIVLLYLFVRGGFFLVALKRLPGRKVPMVNPFRWLTLSEDEMRYTCTAVYPVQRALFPKSVFPRYKGSSSAEVKSALRFPEVRQVIFPFLQCHCRTDRIGPHPLRPSSRERVSLLPAPLQAGKGHYRRSTIIFSGCFCPLTEAKETALPAPYPVSQGQDPWGIMIRTFRLHYQPIYPPAHLSHFCGELDGRTGGIQNSDH